MTHDIDERRSLCIIDIEKIKRKDIELKLLRSSTGASDRWYEIGENEEENEEKKENSIKVS